MLLPPGTGVDSRRPSPTSVRRGASFVATPAAGSADDGPSVTARGRRAAAPVDTAAVEAQAAQALSGPAGVTDGATGIPVTVLAAYRKAEALLAAAKPSCHLPWWLVAGVGRIETGHAFGGRVDAKGNTRGRITGPLLDGSMPGTAVIRDSDGGKWDGDATFDRADRADGVPAGVVERVGQGRQQRRGERPQQRLRRGHGRRVRALFGRATCRTRP